LPKISPICIAFVTTLEERDVQPQKAAAAGSTR
jgi:hypothetical protein